jgi:hypothetical protein
MTFTDATYACPLKRDCCFILAAIYKEIMLWPEAQLFMAMIAFMLATGSKPLLKGAWLLPLHESFASLHPNIWIRVGSWLQLLQRLQRL